MVIPNSLQQVYFQRVQPTTTTDTNELVYAIHRMENCPKDELNSCTDVSDNKLSEGLNRKEISKQNSARFNRKLKNGKK